MNDDNSTKAKIIDILSTFVFCDSPVSECVSEIKITDNSISFVLAIDHLSKFQHMKDSIYNAIKSSFPNKNVLIGVTNKNDAQHDVRYTIEGIRNIMIVSSCKGGVGKSTIASILAQKLSKHIKVGLADADIYGPSIPTIFNVFEQPKIAQNKMIPHVVHDVKINSIGFLSTNNAMVWRGPMLAKALFRIVSSTNWGQLDLLLIDMPPGTGDAHISIIQNYFIESVILVTTPQMIAMRDVERSIDMYQKLGCKIGCMVENHLIPRLTKTEKTAGEILVEKYKISNFDILPYSPIITENCDNGTYMGDLNVLSKAIKNILHTIFNNPN